MVKVSNLFLDPSFTKNYKIPEGYLQGGPGGYGYAATMQQPPKKKKFGGGGMGWGLLGGALGGLMIGAIILDAVLMMQVGLIFYEVSAFWRCFLVVK